MITQLTKTSVKERMAHILKLSPEQLEDDKLLNELALDSLSLVEMFIQLQEEFGTRFQQNDLKDVQTVGELLQLFTYDTQKTLYNNY